MSVFYLEVSKQAIADIQYSLASLRIVILDVLKAIKGFLQGRTIRRIMKGRFCIAHSVDVRKSGQGQRPHRRTIQPFRQLLMTFL